MSFHGELRLNPRAIDPKEDGSELELVVAHTDPNFTVAVLERAAELVNGLHARIILLAVHTVPFPAPYDSAITSHAHLVTELVELATQCSIEVAPQVVLARGREEGFRYVLKPESTVLIGARRHLWETPEERLARMLAAGGHKVLLLHIP